MSGPAPKAADHPPARSERVARAQRPSGRSRRGRHGVHEAAGGSSRRGDMRCSGGEAGRCSGALADQRAALSPPSAARTMPTHRSSRSGQPYSPSPESPTTGSRDGEPARGDLTELRGSHHERPPALVLGRAPRAVAARLDAAVHGEQLGRLDERSEHARRRPRRARPRRRPSRRRRRPRPARRSRRPAARASAARWSGRRRRAGCRPRRSRASPRPRRPRATRCPPAPRARRSRAVVPPWSPASTARALGAPPRSADARRARAARARRRRPSASRASAPSAAGSAATPSSRHSHSSIAPGGEHAAVDRVLRPPAERATRRSAAGRRPACGTVSPAWARMNTPVP